MKDPLHICINRERRYMYLSYGCSRCANRGSYISANQTWWCRIGSGPGEGGWCRDWEEDILEGRDAQSPED